MTKRRTFIALAILILLGSGIGVVYFQQNYEITRKTPNATESEIEKTPETEQILTDAELADYRYRQSVKYFTENHKGDPEELERFLNSPIHKQIVAKVKSPDEITAELSALSDEDWRIQRKEFDEKMKRVREEIKKDKLTPALSPLELKQNCITNMRNESLHNLRVSLLKSEQKPWQGFVKNSVELGMKIS